MGVEAAVWNHAVEENMSQATISIELDAWDVGARAGPSWREGGLRFIWFRRADRGSELTFSRVWLIGRLSRHVRVDEI